MSHSLKIQRDGLTYSIAFNCDLSGDVTITCMNKPLPAVSPPTWRVEVPGALLAQLVAYPCLKDGPGSAAHGLAEGVEHQACERFKAHDDPSAHALRELARRLRALFAPRGDA